MVRINRYQKVSMSAPKPTEQILTGEPNVAGLRVRPFWTMVLYLLLVASAGFVFFVQTATDGALAKPLIRGAPWIFLVFAVGFAAYRFALVAAGRYSPFKAFLQVLIAALFFMLLLFPQSQNGAVANHAPAELLEDVDPKVRTLAAEVIGWRAERTAARRLVGLLDDSSPRVRAAAHDALVRINEGSDLGAADDEASRRAWRAAFP
jgi:hypothetical protein